MYSPTESRRQAKLIISSSYDTRLIQFGCSPLGRTLAGVYGGASEYVWLFRRLINCDRFIAVLTNRPRRYLNLEFSVPRR
jgi:hypothetical protein